MKKLNSVFRPVILDCFKGYDRATFFKDLSAGLVVGVVALPLAIAFAVASGVSPEKGIYTAIIAGFIISVLGGSKVQIGGPTGAFIVIVYGIVLQYGINGLLIATFMAGVLLILMGLARMGNLIQFIPFPLIVGFTTGIALVILSSQVKDFLGLEMGAVPADFLHKCMAYGQHIRSVNYYALAIALSTLFILATWPRISKRIPGSLVALITTTVFTQLLQLPVETIGSRFGTIQGSWPGWVFPDLTLATVQKLIGPAFTIALLGGIESLLSAVVADGLTGGRHRSNTELVAQGAANIFSALFGGIPATGAIARTATNIQNGGKTPLAGIIHAVTLLVIVLAASRWAALIPMATLAGILVVVAYKMSELGNFVTILRGTRSDAAVLLITFFLTVLVDLTVAIEIGMILAAFLFMRSIMKITSVRKITKENTGSRHATGTETDEQEEEEINGYSLPEGVHVFEINGPLFFGAAYKFQNAMHEMAGPARVLILRMGHVPVIDATGIRSLQKVCADAVAGNTKIILSEVRSQQVIDELKSSRLQFEIGKANITPTFHQALERTQQVLQDYDGCRLR